MQHSATGELVMRVGQVERGDAIDVRVSDGEFKGRVTGSKKGLQAWLKSFPSKKG